MTSTATQMKLPQLSDIAVLYPDCCCPISKSLIITLASSLAVNPDTVVSIGSGSGLLEAFLLQQSRHLDIYGVEVSGSINRYLPDVNMHIVRGTWDLSSLAQDAAIWIFVYPRDIQIIRRYFQLYGTGSVRRIIWIGPLADLQELEIALCIEGWKNGTLELIGHDSAMTSTQKYADFS